MHTERSREPHHQDGDDALRKTAVPNHSRGHPGEALAGQVIVTTSDGVLVGLLDRVEAEGRLAEAEDRVEEDEPSCCD